VYGLDNHSFSNWPLTTGRIIGFFVSVLSLAMFTIGLFTDANARLDTSGALMILLAAFALLSCVLSFWQVRLAGIFLVLVSIAFGIHTSAYALD